MSRGLGSMERELLGILARVRGGHIPASDLIRYVAHQRQVDRTAALDASVRRALASLRAKGLAFQDEHKHWVPQQEHARAKARDRSRKRRRQSKDEQARERARAWRELNEEMEEDARKREQASPTRVLAKLLGMMGSHHDGEVLAAARKAEAERRRLDKSWSDLLRSEADE